MNLFKEILVWKPINNKMAVRYFCFCNLENNTYCVQSADYFHLPMDEEHIKQSKKQAIELLLELPPNERCDWFDSLEQAVADHDNSFGNGN